MRSLVAGVVAGHRAVGDPAVDGLVPSAHLNSAVRCVRGHAAAHAAPVRPGHHLDGHPACPAGASGGHRVKVELVVVGLGLVLADERDEPVLGALAGLLRRLVAGATPGGGLGQRHLLQPGAADQFGLDRRDDARGDRASHHQIRVPDRGGWRGGVKRPRGRGGRVQGLPQAGVPGAVGRPPQPQHDPRPGQVDHRQLGEEPGQDRGVDVARVSDEAGGELRGDAGERGQRDPDAPDRPRPGLRPRTRDEVGPHRVARRLGAAAAQQPVPHLVEWHLPVGQPGEVAPVHRERLGPGDQPPERRARGVERHVGRAESDPWDRVPVLHLSAPRLAR